MNTDTQKVRVKDLAPENRHATIFHTFDKLGLYDFFVLIADHNPKPLYFQFLFERSGQFDWQRIQDGPDEWHIQIKRIRNSANEQKSADEIASCKCGKKRMEH